MKSISRVVLGGMLWLGVSGSALASEQYCELLAIQAGLSPKVKIMVDYGNHPQGHREPIVDEDTGRPMKFGSIVGALNYMSSRGWRFVNAFPVSSAVSGGEVYHYLMVRGSPVTGPVGGMAAPPTTGGVAVATTRQIYQSLGRVPDLLSDEWKRDTSAVEALLNGGEAPSRLVRAARSGAELLGKDASVPDILKQGLRAVDEAGETQKSPQ